MVAQSTVVFVMVIAALTVQSSNSAPVGGVQDKGMNELLSLIGDTVTSIKNLPFAWANEYEIAIVFNTGKWSEISISDKAAQMKIAKNNYLSYLIKMRNLLSDLMTQVKNNQRETALLQNDVISWHKFIADLVNKDGELAEDADLAYYQKKFNNSFSLGAGQAKIVIGDTHLEETKKTVDDVTKEMMTVLLETIKHISKEFQNLANEI